MKQHKWAREIKAWADGAEIEQYGSHYPSKGWHEFDGTFCDDEEWKFRIKPQSKEPQYLYVWKPYEEGDDLIISDRKPKKNDIVDDGIYKLIGKIKLEQYDE